MKIIITSKVQNIRSIYDSIGFHRIDIMKVFNDNELCKNRDT